MARIAIVGSGVVGQATGKGFSQLGHEVIFGDVKDDVLVRLRAEGYSATHVHHLPEDPASAIVLSLPTPTEHGRLQLRYLESALEVVADCIAASEDYKLVVVRCTVPPGTTEELIIPRLERASGKAVGRQFGVSHNPEFLRAVSSEQDFLEPWLMVFGSHDERSGRELEEARQPDPRRQPHTGGAHRPADGGNGQVCQQPLQCREDLLHQRDLVGLPPPWN